MAALLLVSSCSSGEGVPPASSPSNTVDAPASPDPSPVPTAIASVVAPTPEIPIATASPEPTRVPEPTAAATAEPTATVTAEPTATAGPSATAQPTATAEPTEPAVPPEQFTYDRVWLVDSAERAAELSALGNQVGVGVFVLPDGFHDIPLEVRTAISEATEVELLSDFGEHAAWRLDVSLRGHELPGGGMLMFDAGFKPPLGGDVRPFVRTGPRGAGRAGSR